MQPRRRISEQQAHLVAKRLLYISLSMITLICVTMAFHEQIRGRRRLFFENWNEKQIVVKIDEHLTLLADTTPYDRSTLHKLISMIEGHVGELDDQLNKLLPVGLVEYKLTHADVAASDQWTPEEVGETIYINPSTGNWDWEKPLLDGWEEHTIVGPLDADDHWAPHVGKTIYWNPKTGESYWGEDYLAPTQDTEEKLIELRSRLTALKEELKLTKMDQPKPNVELSTREQKNKQSDGHATIPSPAKKKPSPAKKKPSKQPSPPKKTDLPKKQQGEKQSGITVYVKSLRGNYIWFTGKATRVPNRLKETDDIQITLTGFKPRDLQEKFSGSVLTIKKCDQNVDYKNRDFNFFKTYPAVKRDTIVTWTVSVNDGEKTIPVFVTTLRDNEQA